MGWLQDTWNKVVANSKKRKAARRDRRHQRQSMKNEYTFYVDPREYDVVQDPVTGQYKVGDTVVFKGSPLYFDLTSELRAYRSKYGVPSNWKTLGSHWDQLKVPVIGAAKDVRQSTAVRQKWIQSSDANVNTITKLYADNLANLDFNRKMLNYAQTGTDIGAVARKTVDVASNSPAGILLAIFKFQSDLILGVFKASIDEAIKENNLIKSTLASKGINVDKRLQELKQVRADEDWELYKYDDLQRPASTQILPSGPSLLPFGPIKGIRGIGTSPHSPTGSSSASMPVTGGGLVPFDPQKTTKTILTPKNIALIGIGAVAIYVYATRDK